MTRRALTLSTLTLSPRCSVVDGSGRSDAGGNVHTAEHSEEEVGETEDRGEATLKGGPLHDVVWIYEELHRWVFANAKAKWSSVARKSMRVKDEAAVMNRFTALFTGYRCVPADVKKVWQLAGLHTTPWHQWNANHLHRFVAFFLR